MSDPDLSRTFGSVADEYDRWRPRYPAEAVGWIASRAPGSRAAEIGAGTGIATALFVNAGFAVTAVEPDPAMVEIGRRQVPDAEWTVAAAEEWHPQPGSYDLVYGAQSWHWIPDSADPGIVRALTAGGVLAWMWNHPEESSMMGEVIDRYLGGDGNSNRQRLHRGDGTNWAKRMRAVATHVELFSHDWERQLSADAYVALIGTYSDIVSLAADRRRQLFDAVRERIESAGGTIELRYSTRVFLGRRR